MFKALLTLVDAYGGVTQDKAEEILAGMGLSEEDCATFWQSVNKSWSEKNSWRTYLQ